MTGKADDFWDEVSWRNVRDFLEVALEDGESRVLRSRVAGTAAEALLDQMLEQVRAVIAHIDDREWATAQDALVVALSDSVDLDEASAAAQLVTQWVRTAGRRRMII